MFESAYTNPMEQRPSGEVNRRGLGRTEYRRNIKRGYVFNYEIKAGSKL